MKELLVTTNETTLLSETITIECLQKRTSRQEIIPPSFGKVQNILENTLGRLGKIVSKKEPNIESKSQWDEPSLSAETIIKEQLQNMGIDSTGYSRKETSDLLHFTIPVPIVENIDKSILKNAPAFVEFIRKQKAKKIANEIREKLKTIPSLHENFFIHVSS